MPKFNKSASRNTRRDNRAARRDDSRLIAAADFSKPVAPKRRVVEVFPKTAGQRQYDAAFKSAKIIFGIGCAGTGKTWFAVQRAAQALLAGEIDKIYVTRPAVEVGAGMGFLPGELEEKFAPYLTPLREAFVDALGAGHYEYLVKNGTIEPVPLAFMRGRNLADCWLIADEMQNATKTEFKMLLTRIGENAKFIINGDEHQVDDGVVSGLRETIGLVCHHSEISLVNFLRTEVVRSGLCQDIVECFEN